VIDSTALIEVPNDYTKEIIEHPSTTPSPRTLGQQLGRDVRLAVTVDQSLDPDAGHRPRRRARPGADDDRSHRVIRAASDGHDRRIPRDERQQIEDRYIGARTERFDAAMGSPPR
jgi:chromosomal replication initiator protein